MKTVLALFLLGQAAFAQGSRYYLYHFAFDDGRMTPELTHTWATFVEVTPAGEIRHDTISWLPRTEVVSVLELGPERGRNATLERGFALGAGKQLGQWGPFEIPRALHELFERQAERLRGGEMWYRVLDTSNRIYKALDPASEPLPPAVMCSHAVADVLLPVDRRGWLLTGALAGIRATAKVAWHFRDWYLGYPDAATAARLHQALGLGRYPIRVYPLEAKANEYCRTLEECRRKAGVLSLSFGG